MCKVYAPVIKIVTGAFFFLCVTSIKAHPLHLSTTSIECDKHNNYYVLVKVFVSDLQKAIVDVKDTKQVLAYVSAHLKLKSESCILPLVFCSYKSDSDAIWYKFEIKASSKKILTIENSILFEFFDDQVNLILFTCKSVSEGYKCTVDNQIIEL